ncbi:flagellar biosynthesis anti-sigma factor FlgM [Tissierella praeacuta]|uniref:Negative regulator of flagellin synthesis n=1 Tax=Tissierella praeacuta DSM 18095 TaxID=1123404 RepID=A0A1M4X146_9FIRM|nr:flagellar biosynthesis anti-sigma factor FlgM [Tissierella praeacuta]MBU5255683.1 flagellar biosynthesis anti-sigma factor FlgM [Tissierella praeacuta]TCU79034.1 FlgM family anti-sigma-28 factor [Tissierella praeacuta]SHE87228.1 anti-sigma-28 factor, FlgM family [Tissierella praeacuta DSM 18095]SUO99622.1 anti-sigma28 factor FlgM [Tissierella praeacuta]
MRINKLDNIFQVYNKNSGIKKVKSDNRGKDTDELKISEKAIEFQYALQKLKDVEDIRMDKVEYIKEQVQSGSYHVDGKKIAEKILETVNFDKKI